MHPSGRNYFMILFLVDLFKMENTCVCLDIIKFERNFRSDQIFGLCFTMIQ